ncbi:transferase family-domain-containing protein [Lipomyces kononenkoae]|uniref:Transferase family-domain-containing protein n=1 Tax=Lipomyces kononenkoae TaxID=34357 RepID=A0ACC3SVQ3_LIPKO
MVTSASLGQVQVTARYELRCANDAAVAPFESPFRLGPMDELVYPFVPIQVVFVYENNALFIPLERLQQALSHLLDKYPHLTGRLQFDPDKRTPEITRLGTGAEILVAQCSVRLDDLASSGCASGRFLMPNLPGSGSDLLPPFDRTIEGICRDPIFAVQHTRFACGSVALGMRLHHIVCDAHGFFQLVRDLAEIYRALRCSSRPNLARPPEIRSYLQGGPDAMSPEEQEEALSFQPSVYYVENCREIKVNAPAPHAELPAGPPVVGRVLRFSGCDLNALKDVAKDPSGHGWVSTFESLCAFLYQRVYRARLELLNSQGVPTIAAAAQLSRGFWAAIDVRSPSLTPSRLNLPARYFPNAVYCPYTYAAHDLLAESPLGQVAKFVHDLIRSVGRQQLQQTTKWVAAQPDKSRIKLDYTFSNGSFTVSQWSKFDMYVGVDFDVDEQGGAIPPALVTPPFTEISTIDGLAMILSTEEQFYGATEQRGSPSSIEIPCAIDVNLTLSEPLWPILDRDEQFRKFCCL